MDSAAKLITAVAAVLNALSWPSAILIGLLIFRPQLRELLSRIKKGKLGFVEVELEHLASSSVTKEIKDSGAITVEQIHTAARIEAQSSEIGEAELLRQVDRLGIEYDTIRRTLPPGTTRTAAMTRVLVQMRAVGRSVASRIDAYKSSGSPGARLAAIAIMQMQPQSADLRWLIDRFRMDAPFIFYHAALALQNAANDADEATRAQVREAAKEALGIVKSFSGTPDQDSIDVLKPLAE